MELLVRGKKSFGHVKIDAKRVSDSGVLCTVVDLHKREELGVRAVTETCSSRLQARDEEMTNCYLKFLTGLTRFTRLLLARYENENLMRKILERNMEKVRGKGLMFEC